MYSLGKHCVGWRMLVRSQQGGLRMKIGSISAIGNITSVRSVSAVQKQAVKSVDTESKSIENDISDVERQKQAFSSKQDLTVDEKMKRRQELQQELSSLKTKLRISEVEAGKESQKEALTDEQSAAKETETAGDSSAAQAVKENAAEAKEKEEAAKEEAAKTERKEALTESMKESASGSKEVKTATEMKDADQAKAGEAVAGTDASRIDEAAVKSGAAKEDEKAGAEADKEKIPGFSKREMQSMISEDEAAERAKQQGTIVARLENDIVILKGEIKQDEDRGGDVTKKKEELKQQEERAQRAVNAQFSAIGQTNRKLQETAQDKLEETRGENAMTIRRNMAEEQPLIRATNFSLAGVV